MDSYMFLQDKILFREKNRNCCFNTAASYSRIVHHHNNEKGCGGETSAEGKRASTIKSDYLG
jgi:hypothetical protein